MLSLVCPGGHLLLFWGETRLGWMAVAQEEDWQGQRRLSWGGVEQRFWWGVCGEALHGPICTLVSSQEAPACSRFGDSSLSSFGEKHFRC